MKLDILPPVEIVSSAVFATESFDIGDKAVIMEILRGKMYSNPIYAIAQEIMCNARDAHREMKKSDLPFEVKLPNKLEPTFQVRDFGPGITPDRIANVFIKYGNSTKRGDNKQTGGFGLGAKTPFAYGDTFAICSVTPDSDGKLVRRDYVAFLEERRMGKLSLVLEKPAEANEPQGTAIIVACKEEDFDEFARSVRDVTQYWEVRPKILGYDGDFQWIQHKLRFSGPDGDWYVIAGKGYQDAVALIDEIPYRLNLNTIYKGSVPKDIQALSKAPIRFIFENGELKITANREDIDYQPSIIELLKARIKKAAEEVRETTCKFINEAKNLFEAVVAWQEMKEQEFFDKDFLKWQGCDLHEEIEVGDTSRWSNRHNYGARLFHWERKDINKHGVPLKDSRRQFTIRKDILLVDDDTGNNEPPPGRITTLFDLHPTIDNIYSITFTEKDRDGNKLQSDDDAVDDGKGGKRKLSGRERFEKAYDWSKFEPIKLSTIERKTFKYATPQGHKKYSKLRKFMSNDWDNETAVDVTTSKGVYVDLYKRHAYADTAHLMKLDRNDIGWVRDTFKLDVFGILSSKRPKDGIGPNFTSLDEFLTTKLAELEADEEVKKYAHEVENLKRGDTIFDLLAPDDLLAECKKGDSNFKGPEVIPFIYQKGMASKFVEIFKTTLNVRDRVNTKYRILKLFAPVREAQRKAEEEASKKAAEELRLAEEAAKAAAAANPPPPIDPNAPPAPVVAPPPPVKQKKVKPVKPPKSKLAYYLDKMEELYPLLKILAEKYGNDEDKLYRINDVRMYINARDKHNRRNGVCKHCIGWEVAHRGLTCSKCNAKY